MGLVNPMAESIWLELTSLHPTKSPPLNIMHPNPPLKHLENGTIIEEGVSAK